MKTLLEYITLVKGIEYLIVVAFGFAFIALWILVHRKEKDVVNRVVKALILLSVIFGVAAITVATIYSPEIVTAASAVSDNVLTEDKSIVTPAPTPAVDKQLKVNSTEYLTITYGHATSFHAVMSDKIRCSTCHHHSGDEIHACKDCHTTPFDSRDPDKPGLKAAYHQRCMACHKEFFDGPNSCTTCHDQDASGGSVVSAPVRPHRLTWDTCSKCHINGIPGGGSETKIVYHDSCLKCHTKGIAGAPGLPADHAGRASNTCQGCHKSNGG